MKIQGFQTGSAVRHADGFAAGGDAAVIRAGEDRLVLAIVDVLGHGPAAHAVAVQAESLLESTSVCDPGALLGLLDQCLAGTIGAAAGLAILQTGTGQGCFVGVGNTVARIFGKAERRLVSVDGVVGQRHPTARPVDFRLESGEVLVLHSDGITSRFQSSDYPLLLSEAAEVVARELIRRFGRNYDDAACIVARRTA